MSPLLRYWPWRVFWLFFMGGIAAFFVATRHESGAAPLLGAGYILFGLSLFLQPVRFNVSMQQNFKDLMQAPAPAKTLSRAGLLLILVGSLLWLWRGL